MKTFKIPKLFLVLPLFFALSFSAWAQGTPPANGASYSQSEAEPYLIDKWPDRAKLQYFSVDIAANLNVQTVIANGAGKVTHVRMSHGKIGDTYYLFTIGVDSGGKLVGKYYVSKSQAGPTAGPCPANCDGN